MNRSVLLAALGLVAATGSAHKVRVDFNHGSHFASYRTYRWVKADADSPRNATFPNQLMQERIVAFVDEGLAARGLKRVTKGGDLLVSYNVKVVSEPVYTTFWGGAGAGWGWGWGAGWDSGPGISTQTVQYIQEGTLILDMTDASRGDLVYEGTSQQTVSSRPEKNTRKLSKAVREILEKYPPQQ
jgi:hypothetical protein